MGSLTLTPTLFPSFTPLSPLIDLPPTGRPYWTLCLPSAPRPPFTGWKRGALAASAQKAARLKRAAIPTSSATAHLLGLGLGLGLGSELGLGTGRVRLGWA